MKDVLRLQSSSAACNTPLWVLYYCCCGVHGSQGGATVSQKLGIFSSTPAEILAISSAKCLRWNNCRAAVSSDVVPRATSVATLDWAALLQPPWSHSHSRATHRHWPLTEGILPDAAALTPSSCCPGHARKTLAGSATFPHVSSSNASLKPHSNVA